MFDIDSIIGWVAQHPDWITLAVFVVAMTESLAVVGILVPGAVLMLGAGALVGVGAVGFWPLLFAAVAGAIAGDGLSYWLGRRYRDRLRGGWPFRNHPQWLERGEKFFRRHGAKSVLLGRFVGPVRPFVPVVAGMFGLRPAEFYVVNVLSAFAWAPAYLLPGLAFGASLAIAGEVAARLAMLLLALVALVWVTLWFMRWLYLELSPRAGSITGRLLALGRRHPRMNAVFGGLLDPSRPEYRSLMVMAILLIGATWLFLGVLEDVVTGDPLVRVDQWVYQSMQSLRTPWGDRIMVFVTELGDGAVVAAVAVAVLGWLAWRRDWRGAAYWASAVLFGQLAAFVAKLSIQRPRPLPELYDGMSTYAFPSGHSTMSMVVYGFLAVLVASRYPAARRWLTYALAALVIGTIAFSRLYLGAHWMSDVVGGLSLGLAWISLLGIAYYRHPVAAGLPRGLPAVALCALMLAGGWHVTDRYPGDLQRYAPRLAVNSLPEAGWWREDWRRLPAYRQDLEGDFEQPLNLQWSGTLASLGDELRARGWRDPVPLGPASALRWLLPDPEIAELPLLPQVHAGRDDALRLVHPLATESRRTEQIVVRLWPSGMCLEPADTPVWVGSVEFQELRHFPLLRLPVGAERYDDALEVLTESLEGSGLGLSRVSRDAAPETEGTVDILLIRNP